MNFVRLCVFLFYIKRFLSVSAWEPFLFLLIICGYIWGTINPLTLEKRINAQNSFFQGSMRPYFSPTGALLQQPPVPL